VVVVPAARPLTINSGDGDDTITGGNGNDVIAMGAGNDTFKTAGTAKDGDDKVSGGGGTDTVDYSSRTAALTLALDGVTTSGDLSGTAEADLLSANSGGAATTPLDIENIISGAGADTLTGNAFSNRIQGGAGDDLISGGLAGTCSSDADILDGEAGNDTFDQGSVADCGDVINGGTGTDVVNYAARSAALTIDLDGAADDGDPAGAGEKDNIKNDNEVILGGSGNDTITGSTTNDELHGGPGNDTLNGGSGNDTLVGNTGNDTLNGEAGDDIFDESFGNDPRYTAVTVTEDIGGGDDIMNGGTGIDDKVLYVSRATTVVARICVDPTKLTGASAVAGATCSTGVGETATPELNKIVNVNHIVGGDGADTITGGSGADTLEGGPGIDTLDGGAGADFLFGDAGDDILDGGSDDDTLDGGAGDDVLIGNTGDGDACVSDAADTTTPAATCEL